MQVTVHVHVGINILVCQGYILRGTGEKSRGYALLMTANKPKTALFRAPTFSSCASHGGLGYTFHGTGERSRGYALLMTANKCCTELPPYLQTCLIPESHSSRNADAQSS